MTLFVQQVLNGLFIGSTYAVVALGFALVFTVMRVINLAHPEFCMIAMYVTVLVAAYLSGNVFIVILAVAVVSVVLGLALEKVVLRPLRNRPLLMPLIATAGVSIFVENLMAGFFGVDGVGLPELVPNIRFSPIGLGFSLAQVVNLVLGVAIMIAVVFYVRHTKWGRATRAIAENSEVAASVGVDVARISQITVALAALLAGFAGVAIGAIYGSVGPFVAQFFALKAFTSMLVAGNRHIEGVMAVALLLGVMEALVTGYLSSSLRDVVAFLVLIVVLWFRPSGLFGSYAV